MKEEEKREGERKEAKASNVDLLTVTLSPSLLICKTGLKLLIPPLLDC